MKKVVCTALLVVALLCFGSVGIAEAHPSRTDANGGHTCRTNCESWGLGYGEYHSHGGGGSTSSGGSTDSSSGVGAIQPIYPTDTPQPTRTPTRLPTSRPTQTPTSTPLASPTPPTQPTPTIGLTNKTKSVQASVNSQPQEGFFDWLFRLLGLR
jgi:hypothetical protein